MCPRQSILIFFSKKNLFKPMWNVTSLKNVLIFLYYYIITNFKFRIFFIALNTVIDICIIVNINNFHFNCSMMYIIVFVDHII